MVDGCTHKDYSSTNRPYNSQMDFPYFPTRHGFEVENPQHFPRYPPFTDWTSLKSASADFAVLGVPNDMGTQYRSGARMGPRGIREASTLYQFGHKDCWAVFKNSVDD